MDASPPASWQLDPTDDTGMALVDGQETTAAGIPNRIQLNDGDFWQQVRKDFRLFNIQNSAINKQTALYADNAKQVEQTLRRGEPYLAYIHKEVEKRNLPGEVVLLPFVESGYDPFAFSHGRAAGLWQFIPSTGKSFGLKQDWWYDERRDVVASTDAALNYLEKLNRNFNGDWLQTFAAYNAGGRRIRNAIRSNRKSGKPTDFWHLKLAGETTNYVPKLLAISRVINNPVQYGVELPVLNSAPGFATIQTGGQLDIVVAAVLAGLENSALYQINPGFNRWATHPEGPHQLAIPVDKADTFTSNLAELPPSERIKLIRHKISSGETLSHIAHRYQTTVKVLQQSNDLGTTRIREGRYLLVPVAAKDSSRYAVLNKRLHHASRSSRKINYTVRNGDSLWLIAKRHQVTVNQLIKWNRLNSASLVKPGQQLVILKNGRKTTSGKHIRTINYTVRNGDSLYLIARRFNVTITDLQRWNSLDKGKYLQPGQRLKIRVDVTRLSQK